MTTAAETAERAAAAPGVRPVDASMDLLRSIQRDALEPEYRRAPTRAAGRNAPRRVGAVGIALAAALLTVAAVQTSRQAPAAADERAVLVERIRGAQQAQDATRARAAELNTEVVRLQAAQVPSQAASQEPLAVAAGQAPVTGPGVVVTVDDPHRADAAAVSDQDLRQLVNGLWTAGAEAVAVNGHRVTARTAIRQAGSAITVDYVSLTRPYRVEAIGSPTSLAGDFAASPGGRWWSFLRSNEGVTYEVATAGSLHLPGDASVSTTTARVVR